MTAPAPVAVPDVGPFRALRPPKVAEGRLRNGLQVLAVRKTTVPRVEVRLIIPVTGNRNRAANRVLSHTLTSGTSRRDSIRIAEDLQRFGGAIGVGVGADNMQIGGSVLASFLGPFLELLAEVVTDAAFPSEEVVVERERIVQEVTVARSQPGTIASEALMRRMFGGHPYGAGLPDPAALARVGRGTVARVYEEVVAPRGALLVLVGDVAPQKLLDLADSALSGWKRKASSRTQPMPPSVKPAPLLVVDRPGSVQTTIRIAGPAPAPDTADAAAIDVANTIFGGYFVSRFVENLRERNGYTYSPHSAISHRRHASFIQISADVGTDVTAPSMVETQYELGRMSALDVTPDELLSAKRYLNGLTALRIQSQAGLASTLAGLVVYGLGVDHLRTYPKKVDAVTLSDVREAARRYLAPAKMVTVMVGDSSRIVADLEPFGPIEVTST